MDNDNSLIINIEAVDDASSVLEGVSSAATDMAANLASAAKEANGALDAVGVSATTMSTEVVDATAISEKSIMEMAGQFLSAGKEAEDSIAALNSIVTDDSVEISDSAIAIGKSFDDAAAEVLGANKAMQTSNEDTKLSSALAAGSLLLLSQQLKQLAGSAVGEIKTAYTETGNWNQSMVELNQIIKNTGSSLPIPELIAFTKHMQDTTLFQQESVLKSENMVMAHKDLQASYQPIINLAADLATKMADSTGGVANLSNATKLLTNAMTDPVTAMQLLKQANVDLSPEVIKAITNTTKQGDAAAASALLMKTLKDEIGGLATAADTASGTGMKKLENNIASMQQNMPSLTDDIDKLANTLNDLLKPLAAYMNAHPEFVANTLIITAAVLSFLAALTGLAANFLLLRIGLAPLLPYLATFAEFIGGAIVTAISAISLPLLVLIGLVVILAAYWIKHWDEIKGGMQVVWDAMKTGFNDAISWLEDVFNSWATKIMAIINPIINAMKSIGGAISGAAGAVGSAITSVLPHFAEGGIVNGPTLALVGEAGPEAIIPLNQLGGSTSSPLPSGIGGGLGGNITVYITGQIFSTENQAKTLGDQIAKAIGRNIKVTSFR